MLMTAKAKTLTFAVVILALGLAWGLVMEWDEIRGDRDNDESPQSSAAAVPSEAAAKLLTAGQSLTYHFDNDAPGQLPAVFHSVLTGRGPAGHWVVQADPSAPSKPNVLIQTSDDNTDYRFPIVVSDEGALKDLQLSVRFKAVSGKVDRAGGLVFRFKDANNYYVVRANALEGNFNFYRVVNGRRTQIAGSNVKVSSGDWHELRVEVSGNRFTCYYDGSKKIETTDDTFKEAGKVGLWTKADSVSEFDDLQATAK